MRQRSDEGQNESRPKVERKRSVGTNELYIAVRVLISRKNLSTSHDALCVSGAIDVSFEDGVADAGRKFVQRRAGSQSHSCWYWTTPRVGSFYYRQSFEVEYVDRLGKVSRRFLDTSTSGLDR